MRRGQAHAGRGYCLGLAAVVCVFVGMAVPWQEWSGAARCRPTPAPPLLSATGCCRETPLPSAQTCGYQSRGGTFIHSLTCSFFLCSLSFILSVSLSLSCSLSVCSFLCLCLLSLSHLFAHSLSGVCVAWLRSVFQLKQCTIRTHNPFTI